MKLIKEVEELLEEATGSIYDVHFSNGKRIRKRKKKDNLYNEPKSAKDNVSLIKARLYAAQPDATIKKDRSMLARGFRDSVYL